MLLLLTLAACAPDQTSSKAWQYADFRWIDPIDATALEFELTAIAARSHGNTLDFRVELLDVPDNAGYTIYLLLDLLPGSPAFTAPDLPLRHDQLNGAELVVAYPPDGRHRAWLVQSGRIDGLQLRSERSPALDWLVLSLDSAKLPGSHRTWKATLLIAETVAPLVILDSAGPFASNGQPPPQAQVLLAFWDTFPAASPALALRRWDGAHTGPYGERHGLNNLLAALRRAELPFFLLDAGEPESLSALDYIEGLPAVLKIVRAGRLVVPAASDAAGANDLVRGFGLPPASIAYANSSDSSDLPYAPLVMARCCQGTQPLLAPRIITYWSAGTLRLDLPPVAPDQINRLGLEIELRRQLVESTHERQQFSPVLMGGSLPVSAWGDARAAEFALAYLQARPWITVLSAADISGLRPVGDLRGPGPALTQDRPGVDIQPPPVESDAWFAWRAISRPPIFPSELFSDLQQTTATVVPLLQFMQDWSSAPQVDASCDQDINQDGKLECVLASELLLAVFNADSGSLMLLAASHPCFDSTNTACSNGYTQIIGPSSQLAIGLSDPSTWQYQNGSLQDPAALVSGFGADPKLAQVHIEGDVLIVTLPQASLAYRLLLEGLQAQIHCETAAGCSSINPRLPLVIAPSFRFQPDWRSQYVRSQVDGGWQIGWLKGPQVQITSPALKRVDSFLDSSAPFSQPENPDREVPPGHFFPFPLTVATFDFSGDAVIEVKLLADLPAP